MKGFVVVGSPTKPFFLRLEVVNKRDKTMTAMTREMNADELRDVIHGGYIVAHLMRDKCCGNCDGYDEILANVKRYLDGDDSDHVWGSWANVNREWDGVKRKCPASAVIANVGEATAYAAIGSGAAVAHVHDAVFGAINAGLPVNELRFLNGSQIHNESFFQIQHHGDGIFRPLFRSYLWEWLRIDGVEELLMHAVDDGFEQVCAD